MAQLEDNSSVTIIEDAKSFLRKRFEDNWKESGDSGAYITAANNQAAVDLAEMFYPDDVVKKAIAEINGDCVTMQFQ